ncbi:hypothetical protein LJB82_02720 [Desulfovibrio sp. OttesenSCG-928-M16]|nr:hypothetical protein [Desulfovibrio sp. OttesenSCG-928-M16]
MNSIQLTQLADALTEIALVLERLGIPGLAALVLTGPAVVLCAVLAIDYLRGKRMQDMVELLRAENALAREQASWLMETYREDMSRSIQDLGSNQDQTDQYYRDNVELVKGFNRMAGRYQDIVVSNTRATERLITILETRGKPS